jgi:hypothetical protein
MLVAMMAMLVMMAVFIIGTVLIMMVVMMMVMMMRVGITSSTRFEMQSANVQDLKYEIQVWQTVLRHLLFGFVAINALLINVIAWYGTRYAAALPQQPCDTSSRSHDLSITYSNCNGRFAVTTSVLDQGNVRVRLIGRIILLRCFAEMCKSSFKLTSTKNTRHTVSHCREREAWRA